MRKPAKLLVSGFTPFKCSDELRPCCRPELFRPELCWPELLRSEALFFEQEDFLVALAFKENPPSRPSVILMLVPLMSAGFETVVQICLENETFLFENRDLLFRISTEPKVVAQICVIRDSARQISFES